METNRAENIQEQYVPHQHSSHNYYTEEDRLRDKLKEEQEKIRKLEAQTRDDKIMNAINELKTEITSVKTELNSKIDKLDSRIDSVKKDLETKIDTSIQISESKIKLWTVTTGIMGIATTIGGILTLIKMFPSILH